MGESLIKIKQYEVNNKKVVLWEISEYNEAYYLIKSENFLSDRIYDFNTANIVFEKELELIQNETTN